MKTLTDPGAVQELIERLDTLSPNQNPVWGRMNVGQMVRHLLDTYELAMGQRTASEHSNWFQRTVIKYLALHTSMPWPKGVPTRPEFDQEKNGTPPGVFTAEVEELKRAVRRFATHPRDFQFGRHPIFLELTEWEWMRWAYAHCDHHLRQFGR